MGNAGVRRLPFTPCLVALLGLAVPSAAGAQASPPKLPRFDLAALGGWGGADESGLPAGVYRTWDGAGVGSGVFGVYWTEHLKTEVEIGGSGERRVFGSEAVRADRDGSQYIHRQHTTSTRSVSLTPTYQFLHNAWVHPFVGVGLDIDRDRRHTEGEIRTTVSLPSGWSATSEPLPEVIERHVHVRPALSAGVKVYFLRRAFLRSDVRMAFGNGIGTAKWRVGAGMDF